MDGRSRQRELQRQHVVAVAFDLFRERGYEQTTVEEIADAAEISPRTFYRYFEAKDGLFSELGIAIVRGTLDRLEPAAAPPHVGALARTLTEVFASSLDSRRGELCVRLLRENPALAEKAGRWRERWAARLGEGLAEADGRDRPTFSEQVVSRTAIAIVTVAIDHWVRNDPAHGSITDAVEAALSVLATSLG